MVSLRSIRSLLLATRSLDVLSWLLASQLLLVDMPAAAQDMIFPGAQWESASPESVMIDSQLLQQAIDRSPDLGQRYIIVRNGRVVAQGSGVNDTRHIYSATKSFTSTALGLLVDDGRISLDALAKDIVPELAERYGEALVRHFATHTSGYAAQDETLPLAPGPPPPDPFAPGDPVFTPPGSHFAYTGTSMDMLSNLLTRAGGEPIKDLFTRRIAVPIGINLADFEWTHFVASDGVVVTGGSGYADLGVRTSASNLARLGHLFVNDGNWDGQPLISSDWIEQATQVQVPRSIPLHPLSATPGPGEYGLGWWIEPFGYAALGYEDNQLLVNPNLNLVVARLGPSSFVQDTFMRNLAEAVQALIWDESGDGVWNDVEPNSGQTRWVSPANEPLQKHPAPHTGNAIIRTNTVRVADDQEVYALDIESGGLAIDRAASLHVGGKLSSAGGTRLDVSGSLTTGNLDLRGTATIEAGAHARINVIDARGDSSAVIAGDTSVDTVNSQGVLEVAPNGHLVVGDLLQQLDGTLRIAGPIETVRLRQRGGVMEIHNHDQPVRISDEFRLVTRSQLEFHLDSDPWMTGISVAENAFVRLSGKLGLVLSPGMDLAAIAGETFQLFQWQTPLEDDDRFLQIELPPRTSWDLSQLYVTGEVTLESILTHPLIAGDFDGSGQLDVDDIDALGLQIRSTNGDTFYDLNDDNLVDSVDLSTWIHEVASSWFGDANLDGKFNSADLVAVLAAGEYEDDVVGNSGWAEGDFDGDGDFTSADLIVALADGGYEQGPRQAVNAVPEPGGIELMAVAFVTATSLLGRRRLRIWHLAPRGRRQNLSRPATLLLSLAV